MTGTNRPQPDLDLMTLRQAAMLLAVSYDTMRAWCRKGVIVAVRVGPAGALRVRRVDVLAQIRPAA